MKHGTKIVKWKIQKQTRKQKQKTEGQYSISYNHPGSGEIRFWNNEFLITHPVIVMIVDP